MKPKQNKESSKFEIKGYDGCQTPKYAVEPILPYLDRKIVWESACGENNLLYAISKVADVIGSDRMWNPEHDFFRYQPFENWDIQVTNPPFTLKYDWLERSYELNKPFALLLPVETLGARKGQKLFEKYGIQVMFVSPRINFKMPVKGWESSSSQFPTAWFTWNIGLPKEMNYAQLDRSIGNE